MGGFGSGRPWHGGGRGTVEGTPSIDINRLIKRVAFVEAFGYLGGSCRRMAPDAASKPKSETCVSITA